MFILSFYTNISSKYLPRFDFTAHRQENFLDKTANLFIEECFNLFKVNRLGWTHFTKEVIFGAHKKNKTVLEFFVPSA